jgi:hypothetical protein
MTTTGMPGRIVVLNGAPRSGKSSIAAVIQETFDGPWLNLGVDVFSQHVMPRRPDIEAVIPALYAAFYDSVAAHSRHGLNVVVDVDHHDAYSRPLNVLPDAARRLEGLPATRSAVPAVRCRTRCCAGSARCTAPASTTWRSTPPRCHPRPRRLGSRNALTGRNPPRRSLNSRGYRGPPPTG